MTVSEFGGDIDFDRNPGQGLDEELAQYVVKESPFKEFVMEQLRRAPWWMISFLVHTLVLLKQQNLEPQQVLDELERRQLKRALATLRTVLEADLAEADLMDAELSGADLQGARYNSHTRWPIGFDPKAAGAIRELSS